MKSKLIFLNLIILFLILPLTIFPKLYDWAELPKAIVFILTINFTIGIFMWDIIPTLLKKIKQNRVLISLIVFYTVMFSTTIINSLSGKSIWGNYFRYQGLIMQIHYLALVAILFYFQMENKILKITKIIAAAGIINCFIILIQSFLKIFMFNNRAAAFLGNPNFAGGYLVISFIYLTSLLKTNKQLVLPSLLFLVSLLLTQSRSAIIAFLVVLIIRVWAKSKNKRNLILALVFIALISTLAVFSFNRPVSSFDNRILIWQRSIKAFSQKPIFGWGIENFDLAFQSALKPSDFDFKNIRVDHAHNIFLAILINYGLLGLLAYLGLLYYLFYYLFKNKKDGWAATNFLALIAFLIIGQFNVLNINEYLFFYLVVSAGVYYNRKELDCKTKN